LVTRIASDTRRELSLCGEKKTTHTVKGTAANQGKRSQPLSGPRTKRPFREKMGPNPGTFRSKNQWGGNVNAKKRKKKRLSRIIKPRAT